MPHTLKILSWNIQKFGEDKLNDNDFIDYIVEVIANAQADVVGIMEIVGWIGNELRDKLVSHLNNWENLHPKGGTVIQWNGEPSEMTPSRPNEQYLFLWKKDLFSTASHKLWNIVGDTEFNGFFLKYGFDATWQENFWKSMYKNGYLDAAYMLPFPMFEQLLLNPASLDLTKKAPKVVLTPQQKDEITLILVAETPAAFPVRGSRPPFILQANTKDTNTPITFVLFHAPGPGDNLSIAASNQLVIPAVKDAIVGVVMGDFNVSAAEAAKQRALQYFDMGSGKLDYVKDATGSYINAVPFQTLTGPAFAFAAPSKPPDRTAVANYGKRLWDAKTDITPQLVNPSNTIADPGKIGALFRSEYDKFFVRTPLPDPSLPYVCPLIDCMIPKKVTTGYDLLGNPIESIRSTTPTPYVDGMSTLAKLIYDKWWDRQNSKPHKSAETIARLGAAPKLTQNRPYSLFEAHYVYHAAISDHLPIVMELRYA